MGAGKTSIGGALAHRLGWKFVDLDHQVEIREHRTVAEIFRQSGEAYFRRTETRVLIELLGSLKRGNNTVMALGGGAFAQPANISRLEKAGVRTIFLDASPEELWKRCRRGRVARPLLRSLEDFTRLYDERRCHYMKAALRIDTSGKVPADVVREIESLLVEQS